MVVISIKNIGGGNNDGFLFETTTDTPNDTLIENLVSIHNDRLRSKVIIDSVRGLVKHGIMKNPNSSSFPNDQLTDGDAEPTIEKESNTNNNYEPDPTGMRMGDHPDNLKPLNDEHIMKELLKSVQDLEEYIDKAQVQKRIDIKPSCLYSKINIVRDAVSKAYPMGLPDYDLVTISLDGDNDLKSTYVANDMLDPTTTSLWCAGKEFQRGNGNKVSDRLGSTNEKTRVIAKLTPNDSGPPSREPIVNEEERKAMMAHYFKRQEELKKLAEAENNGGDGDEYLNSEWADSRQMKRNLQGLDGGIKAPGLRFP